MSIVRDILCSQCQVSVISRATKPLFSQVFLTFLKFMKSQKNKFHDDAMSDSKILGQKSQNLSLNQTFVAAQFLFSLSLFY